MDRRGGRRVGGRLSLKQDTGQYGRTSLTGMQGHTQNAAEEVFNRFHASRGYPATTSLRDDKILLCLLH